MVYYCSFINSYVESKVQLFRFNLLLITVWENQSSSAKIRGQKQKYYALTRSLHFDQKYSYTQIVFRKLKYCIYLDFFEMLVIVFVAIVDTWLEYNL